MPTHYLYGTVLTGQAVAANNRGDNIGNTTTLQKVFVDDDLHTSVSAEAIRFALRYRFQLENVEVNRTYDTEAAVLNYFDEKRTYYNRATKNVRIDDDLMGFMDAEAAKVEREAETDDNEAEEAEAAPAEKGPKKNKTKPKAKGKTVKRPSPLAVGRAISLRPYRGEISFNCVSGAKTESALSLYNAEMHTTEYQYSFGLNLGDVIRKDNIAHLLDAIADPPPVAGNHARFAYDFSPVSVVLRVCHAHSSRIQNCFEHDEKTRAIRIARLFARVRAGDIPASELILAGEIARSPHGAELKGAGATVIEGIDAAFHEAKRRIAHIGPDYATLAPKGS